MKRQKKGNVKSKARKKPLITLRGHHLIDIRKEYRKPGSATDFGYELNYGIKNTAAVKKLINRILTEDIPVRIIADLDDMCRADCALIADDCTDETIKEYDKSIAEHYGFKVGKTYSSKELIDKLINKNIAE